LELKWDILLHPPYSLDIAPSDNLTGCSEGCSSSLLSQKSKISSKIGLPPKATHFFEMEFENCLRDGEKVVGSDGQYFN